MLSSTADRLMDLFSTHGLRCTRQRKALYEALMATKMHPTADMLYREVLDHCPGMSLATVYNTLEAFCDAGLIQKIPGPDGSARYDGTNDNHPHLRVQSTGEVLDLPGDLSTIIEKSLQGEAVMELEKRMGFKVKQIRIEFVGEYA